MKHFRIIIKGKVQGVFFRKNAQEYARKMDIMGFVRNEPDGTVYIEAEGSEDDLERFIKWCKMGSPEAKVSEIDTFESSVKGYREFTIEV